MIAHNQSIENHLHIWDNGMTSFSTQLKSNPNVKQIEPNVTMAAMYSLTFVKVSYVNVILLHFPKIFVDNHPRIGMGVSMLFHYFNFQEIDHI